MHVGVIGTGRIGQLHTEIINAIPRVERVSVTDAEPGRAEAVAASIPGVQAVGDVATLIGEADAIVITAATPAHVDLILQCVAAGTPTFCEKPISLDLDSTRHVVEQTAGSDVPVQIGFNRRFDRGFVAAAEAVRSGSVGTLYIVRMIGHDPAPPHEEYIPHSGGLFCDFSVHDFDALRFVTGEEVVEVYADGSVCAFPVFAKYGDIDTGAAMLKLESGAIASLTVTRHNAYGYDIRMELVGSKDSIVVGLDERAPFRSVEATNLTLCDRPYANFQDRFRPAYEAELAAFLEVAAGERANPCTPADAMEALRIALACDRSRAEHRPVRVQDVT